MGFFSSWVGDVPGSPQAVFSLANDINKMHQVTDSQEKSLRSAPSLAPSWKGYAADAFESSHHGAVRDLARLSDGLEDGHGSVIRYGSALQECKAKAAELKDAIIQLDITLDKLQGLDKVKGYIELLPTARQIQSDYSYIVSQSKKNADICAVELRNALHLEAVNRTSDGGNLGSREELSDKDIESINEQLKNMNPNQVNQGGIGDCYFLASLASIMQTEEGRKWVQSCIKPHYDANGKQDGYLVTIYDDPMHPDERTARTVLVTDIYDGGVKGKDGKPSVASIMEAAYGQEHPGGTNSGNKGGISGGSPEEGIEDLTGENAETTRRNNGGIFGLGSGYNSSQQNQITEATNQHKPVVAETSSAPEENFPEGDNHDSANVNVKLSNGEQGTISIPRGHAYTVVDSDANGVTLYNPWGSNYLTSGDQVGGTFTMSWEDFGKYYGSVSIGDGYK